MPIVSREEYVKEAACRIIEELPSEFINLYPDGKLAGYVSLCNGLAEAEYEWAKFTYNYWRKSCHRSQPSRRRS